MTQFYKKNGEILKFRRKNIVKCVKFLEYFKFKK